MIIKKDMIIREVGTETILVPMGNALKEHNGLFMLSDSACFLWEQLSSCNSVQELANAIEYVNVTKNIEEENLKPTEKRVVNKRSVVEKRVLVFSIVAIAITVIAVAVLLTTDLYNLFS